MGFTNHLASTFTGQPSRPGLATLPEARSLAEHLEVPPTIGNLKALNALREHRKHIEKSCAYADALAAVPPPTSSTSCVEEVPDVVMQAATLDKHPRKTTIMKVGLPLDPKGKDKAKEVMPPVKISDNGEEKLDRGSDDDYDVGLTESAGIHQRRHSWHADASNGDVMDSMAYDHIPPQVPFLSIGLIGSLIIESSQGQLCDGRLGRVDNTLFCICKLENTSLSISSCTECEKCKQSAMGKVKGLV